MVYRYLIIICAFPLLSYLVDSLEWYDSKVIYQIYPKSFADSDGDGVGDLKGILSRVNHFKDLGIGAVWLSPIFKSPMKDNGYDISDYLSINNIFGSMNDLKNLIKAFHDINIKVLLDLVPNHTSDEHQWFQDSVNKANNKSDYYIWAKPDKKDPDGKWIAPNNWLSLFGGSAWTFNERRQEFYLHQFGSYQPDLNFRNPNVIEELKNVMRYWMDMGIDGFRVDAVPYLVEDASFRSEKQKPDCYDVKSYDCYTHEMTKDLQGTFDVLKDLGTVVNETKYKNSPRILLAEAYSDLNTTMKYYSDFVIPFNFQLLSLQRDSSANDLENTVNNWMKTLPQGKRTIWVIGNHDNSRIGSKMGEDMIDAMNMLVFLAPGNTVTYYGEEIGMTDLHIKKSLLKDNRDPERTPMQWNNSTSAGFSNTTKTWLPVNPNYWKLNRDQQNIDKKSHLKIYKDLVKLQNDIINNVSYTTHVLAPWIFALSRSNDKLIINLDDRDQMVNLTVIENTPAKLTVKISSLNSVINEGDSIDSANIPMRPRSAIILSQHPISGASKTLQNSIFLLFGLMMLYFF